MFNNPSPLLQDSWGVGTVMHVGERGRGADAGLARDTGQTTWQQVTDGGVLVVVVCLLLSPLEAAEPPGVCCVNVL